MPDKTEKTEKDPAVPAATPPGPPDAQPAATYLEGVADNYAQYVAVATVPYGSAIAAQPGDPIPADHPMLKAWVKDGIVEAVKGT
jgi:hypothetical protein